MADIASISDFLIRVEGPRQRRGYVPSNRRSDGKGRNYIGPVGTEPLGVQFPSTGDPAAFVAMDASGVTIATGCDLGQTDAATLRGYGLPEAIIRIFTPYLGLRKSAALDKLFVAPLAISEADATATDHAVHAGYLNRYVRPAYDRDSSVPFDDLPRQAQAVIFSCCFQKGCGGVRRDWPKTWQYLTTQNWCKAADELLHGFRQYAQRRAIEGRLLKELC